MNDEKRLVDYPQDAVLADYKGTRAFQARPIAEESLCQFFSPSRIPIGLTDNEVAIIIRLFPYQERMNKRYNEIEDAKLEQYFKTHNIPPLPQPTLADALSLFESGDYSSINEASEHLESSWRMAEYIRRHPYRKLPLPKELYPYTEMTRERFRRGVREFIAQYRKNMQNFA